MTNASTFHSLNLPMFFQAATAPLNVTVER
jgi:hypothetical protein